MNKLDYPQRIQSKPPIIGVELTTSILEENFSVWLLQMEIKILFTVKVVLKI